MLSVVTGGCGFIGSHLCEFLLGKGHRVLCVDNLLTGSEKNIAGIAANPNFKFLKHDITKPLYMADKPDFIFHFASPASPEDYVIHQIHTMKVGAIGTMNCLGLAKATGARFLLASTSEVYGDPLVSPQPESYLGNVDQLGVRGVYDEAKRFGEALTMAYHRIHKVNTGIVRIFNTYGPRMRANDGRVVCTFISEAIENQPLTIQGNGKQTRSFCYVSDLVPGIIALAFTDEHMPVNLGNPHEMTVMELARKVIALTGSKSEIQSVPPRPGDPRQRKPDISRAHALLKWEPKVSIEEGLNNTIAYFRSLKKSA